MSARRRAVRALAAGLCASGALVAAFVAPADAASDPVAGWWARTTLSLDRMQPVPDGHLAVELAPDGPAAVMALSIDATGAVGATLELPIAEESSIAADSQIQACAVPAPTWTPTDDGAAGAWDDRPAHDPESCVDGVVDEAVVSFVLDELLAADRLDVLIVPAGGAFSTAGERLVTPTPTASSVAFAVPPPPPTPQTVPQDGASEPVDAQPQPAVPASSGAAPRPAAPTPTTAPVRFDPIAPPPPTSSPVAVTPPATNLSAAPAAPTVAAPTEVAIADSLASGADGTDQGRLFGLVLVAAGLAVAVWAHVSSDEDADHIGLGRFRVAAPSTAGATTAAGGSLAAATSDPVLIEPMVATGGVEKIRNGLIGADGPVTGGLGRFARERTTEPTPLV